MTDPAPRGLAYDVVGSGPPLLLLHGTTSARSVWDGVLPELSAQRTVLAVDLPGHGESPATSFTPMAWSVEVASLLDQLGWDAPPVVGHSSGGWTALELAKRGRVGSVLALTPAGLWRKRSPLITDLLLWSNWRLGRALPRLASSVVRTSAGRRLALRSVCARPADVPVDVAVIGARQAGATDSFPEHFRQTRRARFTDGASIAVPVRVVWGDCDRIARAGKSQWPDELPAAAEVETWAGCGHMVMWDAPQRVIEAALAVSA